MQVKIVILIFVNSGFFIQTESCRVLFTVDVQYTSSIEHTQTSPANTEQPSCPVCLGNLYIIYQISADFLCMIFREIESMFFLKRDWTKI